MFRELNSDLKVVALNLVSSNILDRNGVKDMPRLIPAPILVQNIEKYNYLVTPTKKIFKKTSV